jgi:hypothetical protein
MRGAWVVKKNGLRNLTERQSRKPLIGSGAALPMPFFYNRTENGILLLATDGLLKYASAERIANVCRQQKQAEAARALIELVRYPSGVLAG